MKKLLLIILLAWISPAKASHIIGGELYYELVGPDPIVPGNFLYNVHLKLYRDCNSIAQLPAQVVFLLAPYESPNTVDVSHIGIREAGYPVQISGVTNNPCLTNPPTLCYEYAIYTYKRWSIPARNLGYSISFQDCCRVSTLLNIDYSSSPQTGATYSCEIPGTNFLAAPNAPANSNPHFGVNDATIICADSYFEVDFSATDADGDQLVYSLCEAYNGQAAATVGPPFTPLTYNSGYSALQPMGPNVSLNPLTGVLSGIAPTAANYVVTVCCAEYRNGVMIGTARKDFQIKVNGNCSITVAATNGNSALGDNALVDCKDLTVTFSNISTGPTDIVFNWNFGDPTTLADTSHEFEPTYTYPSPGTYTATLIVTNSTGCADTVRQTVRVYPVLNAGAKYFGSCVAAPFIFTDTSFSTSAGNVIIRKWDFGEPTLTTDTISNVNPVSFTYPQTGTKNVSLIIINDVGCTDTTRFDVLVIDKPVINASPRDTLICLLDSITIRTNPALVGTFSWSPNYMIDHVNVARPKVSPDTDTKYVVYFDNGAGCANSDSIFVRSKIQVDINIINKDSAFCRGDSVQIRSTFTGTAFSWSPSSGLNSTSIANPKAAPSQSTAYFVSATLGDCPIAKDSVTLTPVNIPQAAIINHLLPDTSVCKNALIQIIATGGSTYSWSPSSLVIPNNNDTVTVSPSDNTIYTVVVGDTLGCTKTTQATYTVNVSKGITANAGRDTVILNNSTITLHGSGGTYYTWSPSYNLSDASNANPMASIGNEDSIYYHLVITDDAGCRDEDSVLIRVFKGIPGILIPTVFSPNAIDSRNRTLKPLCFGIRQLNYFRVYDRYGHIVFETNICNTGWNGTIKGKPAPAGTYVFTTSGIDILGNLIQKKGFVVLLK